MTIRLACVDTIPLGVDTQEDLEKARKFYKHNFSNDLNSGDYAEMFTRKVYDDTKDKPIAFQGEMGANSI